jgi:aspartate carbamoyltransferase catalytic subunit
MVPPQLVLGVEDLEEDFVSRILVRAQDWRFREAVPTPPPRVLGLLFLEPSLRTRAGFAAAAARLGWSSIEVSETRSGPASMPESWDDTLRTFAGFVDVVIMRDGRPVDRATLSKLVQVPLVNGGDAGPDAQHPSQAIIDLFAIRRQGAIDRLAIAVCGDLRMRAVRSLLRLLARTPPRRLIIATDPGLEDSGPLPESLAAVVERRRLSELDDVDVLYIAGMPHACLPEERRRELRVTARILDRLPPSAVVLSPLPLLDEIDPEARRDPRVQMFEQSANGVAVRMALLEALVSGTGT